MTFVADKSHRRLDVYLEGVTNFTRSYIKQLIDGGYVEINGEIAFKSGEKVRADDVIDIEPPEAVTTIEARNIPIDIIYEDSDIAVINKSQGLTVHPAPGNYDNTLVNALLYHLKGLSSINGVMRPGIVHRLDKNTSGVIVVAKNDFAHLSLSTQIAQRKVTKLYVGLVVGHLTQNKGIVSAPIGRNPRDRKLMAVVESGREAITEFEVIERYVGYDLVRFHILTGRTHQIRVHAKYMGHPIVGDCEYGRGSEFGSCGQLLHSQSLTITHPISGEEMTFIAPLPEYFQKIISKLKIDK